MSVEAELTSAVGSSGGREGIDEEFGTVTVVRILGKDDSTGVRRLLFRRLVAQNKIGGQNKS